MLDAGCGALEATAATSGNCCLKFAKRSSAGFRELVLWRAYVLEMEVKLGGAQAKSYLWLNIVATRL